MFNSDQPATVFVPQGVSPTIPTNEPPPPPIRQPNRPRSKKLLFSFLGLAVIAIGGVSALVLVNQRQLFENRASCESGKVYCRRDNGSICPNTNSANPAFNAMVGGRCSGGIIASCDFYDACAPQTGGSCEGKVRLSDGEASHGGFVGCSGSQNCFCGAPNNSTPRGASYGSNDGNVTCYADAGNDSCGAYATGASAPASTPSGSSSNIGGWGNCGCYGSGECRDKVGSEGAGATHPANECQMGPSGTCVWNPSLCGSGGGSTQQNIDTPNVCGETCNSDSECYPTGANGATERCINGICQNTSCVGKTIPGRNCDCSALNACGQKCGAAVGLCQPGSQCGYIAGGTQCAPPGTEGNINNTYCIPTPPYNGYTTGQCTGIATIYLKKPDGSVVNTQADVIAACSSAATPAPTPSPTPVTQAITAQCLAVKIYDQNWNLLTTSALSNLTAGSVVRFGVTGSVNGGSFDKARFVVNGITRAEVTNKRPGTDEYYDEYTIPAGATSFSVNAQLHHTSLGWF